MPADLEGGGGQGSHVPPWPVKKGYIKMSVVCVGLYFLFLGPPSRKFLDPLLDANLSRCE